MPHRDKIKLFKAEAMEYSSTLRETYLCAEQHLGEAMEKLQGV